MSTEPVAGRVSDGELQRLRSKIGEVVELVGPPYLTVASADAIRHWAYATGDRNPLYLDAEYAGGSVHGHVVAPPTMMYAFSPLAIGYRGGLPGVHSMFGGSHWRWRRWIAEGEGISVETTFSDLVELPSRFAGRMFKQVSHIVFRSSGSDVVAEADSWGMRTERAQAAETGKYRYLEPATYSREDLQVLAQEYEQEWVRRRDPLYWDDVAVGEALPRVVRGPYTATTAIAFEQAWGGLFIRAHGYWFEFLRRHPRGGLLNAYGVPEPPEAVHWDRALARSVGVPDAYDYGPERISWLATMITNWMGDEGFLSELYCEVRRFNLLGDVTRCSGSVIDASPGPLGSGSVRLSLSAVDQRGEETVRGWALVHLPRKRII